MTLRVAFVGGPMYDGLYEKIDRSGIELVVHADHPSLNRAVQAMLGSGERLDVISTHSKYVASQRQWLFDLSEVIDTRELANRAVELCSFEGSQFCVPRNIDVRVLWANRAQLGEGMVPTTWPELAGSGLAFAFPGRESGLFGTVFEIVAALGGALFDGETRPDFNTDTTIAALELLLRVAKHGPPSLPTWHYDESDAALAEGEVPLGAAWPGATAALRASRCGADLEPHPYFGGAQGIRSYAGCHAWAIPRTCGDPDAAIEFVQQLCSFEMHASDTLNGSICAHEGALAAVVPIDARDGQRLAITTATIRDGMLTYPPMARFPQVEDQAWSAIHAMLIGEREPAATAALMQTAAIAVLEASDAV